MAGGVNFQPGQRNAMLDAADALWNARPGYVNQSDGSVGIVGKAIGALGLDLEGRRAATSWEDAWRNSVDPAPGVGGIVPLAVSESGEPSYAVPGLISAPVEGFNAMWERGDEANISNPVALAASSADSFDAAGGAMTGGLAATVAGVGAPRNAVGIFGGRLAKTADHNALARAESLSAQGAPRQQIWDDTGWFQGNDGQWRFEIPDNAASVNLPSWSGGNVGAAVDHPEFFAAYPDAANIKMVGGAAPKAGFWDADRNAIGVGKYSPESDKSLMLHELQHYVQDTEGFARGSNLGAGSRDQYRRAQGEVEARNVETRMDLPPEQRQEWAPWSTQDVPDAQQLAGAVPEGALLSNGAGRRTASFSRPMGATPEHARWMVDNYGSPEAALKELEKGALPDWMPGAAEMRDANATLSDIIKSGLYANSPTGSSVPLAVNAMERKGITAYHGSPHDFDKFDMSKIGTGEGAQVYGHGLYFAENEAVAKGYREALSAGGAQNQSTWMFAKELQDRAQSLPQFSRLSERDKVSVKYFLENHAMFASRNGAPLNESIEQALRQAEYGDGPLANVNNRDEVISAILGAENKGRMYEVNINAEPEHFLDWDAPLSQQSEAVRKAGMGDESQTGQDLYWKMSRVSDETRPPGVHIMDWPTLDQVAASQALREAGIPGIRFLDQGSREAGQGTRNYVVFDDSLVNINRKYANHPFGAASPLVFTDYDEQPRNAMLGY